MEACKLPEVASNLQETPEKIFTVKTPIIEMPWNGQRHILILNPIESIPEILVHTIPILICEKRENCRVEKSNQRSWSPSGCQYVPIEKKAEQRKWSKKRIPQKK